MNTFANLPLIRLEIDRTKRTGCRIRMAAPAAGWGSPASPSSPPPLN